MYRIETTTDEGATWTEVHATDPAKLEPGFTAEDAALDAWDRYCDLSKTERVRLFKDDRVISTSHCDDVTQAELDYTAKREKDCWACGYPASENHGPEGCPAQENGGRPYGGQA